jgi:transketolase
MEGISSEAASIAGHLGLSNLCWIYDSNRITIEGETDLAFSEDVAARFQAAGWNVLDVGDANDTARLAQSFARARGETHRPTLVIVHSHIGFGAPKKQDTHSAHGEPLGDEEIKGAKRNYGWPEEAKFLVPEGVRERFTDKLGTRGALAHSEWKALFAAYHRAHPALAAELELLWRGDLPAGWEKALPSFPADAKGMASRDAGGKVLNALAAAVNGMALSGLRSFGSTFLVFLDYMKPAVRLSAIMNLPAVHVFTHDSIGVGEDGPTHQPIEQLATLRATPGLYLMRPGDANETAECWRVALEQKHKPSVLALTRQALPTIDRAKFGAASGARKGAYVLADAQNPQLILIGTGSEVSLCLAAHEKLKSEGIASRVVSMPCWELFSEQPQAYRDEVLPPEIGARVAVEQASGFGWERWVGIHGAQVCMQGFGASAPLGDLQKRFGFTVENVVARAKQQLALAAT